MKLPQLILVSAILVLTVGTTSCSYHGCDAYANKTKVIQDDLQQDAAPEASLSEGDFEG